MSIFGSSGSGKGTQGERIVEKEGIKQISNREIFRAQIERPHRTGRKIC